MAVTVSLAVLKESLLARKDAGETWAGMGREYDVNPAVLWRIANESYNPKKAELRSKLCLPEIIQIEIHHNDNGYKMEQTTR